MTGLIYIVIIGLWAAVLIPMWLRRHDQISEVRSTARFSSAMRTLGRDSRGRTIKSPVDQRSQARADASRRRLTVLAVLVITLLVTSGMYLMAMVPVAVPVIVGIALLGFLAAMFLAARARRSSARFRDTYFEEVEFSEQSVVTRSRQHQAHARSRREGMTVREELEEFENWDPWAEDEDADSWQAVPTTLPTYVSKPRATSVPRGIERAHGGEWNGQKMVSAAREMRRPRITVEDLEDERYGVIPPAADLDATSEIPAVGHPRAANG